MSRLNVEYVVLSKRKLIHLVTSRWVRGWDDPRMPTIKGLRRRGYTAAALNAFCTEIGVTRNENLIEYGRMEEVLRQQLDRVARRAMCVLRPLKLTIASRASGAETLGQNLQVPDFPQDKASPTHALGHRDELFIDASDFREEDDKGYYGLAPNKWVGLKYSGCFLCQEVVRDPASGSVVEVKGVLAPAPPDGKRPKGNLHWVPSGSAVPLEVRLYGHLFTVPFPTANWEQELNKDSLVVCEDALVDPSILGEGGALPAPETHFQFERVGVFVVDKGSGCTEDCGGGGGGGEGGGSRRLVMNRTVALKVSKAAAEAAAGGATSTSNPPEALAKEAKRKADQAAALAAKLALEAVDPKDMFKRRGSEHFGKYSAFDEDGVPTHDAEGEPLPKSQVKKLKKDWVKQKKNFEKANSKK